MNANDMNRSHLPALNRTLSDEISRRDFLTRLSLAGVGVATLPLLTGCGGDNKNSGNNNNPGNTANLPYSGTLTRANSQMRAVLDAFLGFKVPPLYTLTPQQARLQPGVQDAFRVVQQQQGKSTVPEAVGSTRDITIPGPAGDLTARVYTPSGSGPFPILVYFHGGGFVIATIDTYDASARALTNAAQCVVVSVEYRKGPENKFPAAHEDAYAATQYVIANATQPTFGGIAGRVAVGGESAGGNLAAAVCLLARDRGGALPAHQLLVYPVAGYNFATASYETNANAIPLNRPTVQYFLTQYLNNPAVDGLNPLINLVGANLTANLPSATVITDSIDPLQSEGQQYATLLQNAGVSVRYRNYDGVTHEFFGGTAVLDKARDAVSYAADGLKSAFTP